MSNYEINMWYSQAAGAFCLRCRESDLSILQVSNEAVRHDFIFFK
ncbi:hypothetical protein [Pseudomonas farris]